MSTHSAARRPGNTAPRQCVIPVAARGTRAQAGKGPRERPRTRGRQAHPRAILPGVVQAAPRPAPRRHGHRRIGGPRGMAIAAITLASRAPSEGRLPTDLLSSATRPLSARATWKSSQLGMTGTCWRMTWSAIDPVFRLARKADRQRTEFRRLGEGKGRAGSAYGRFITACEPVESVPVRCITVDSEAHQFCATDSLVACCNSAEALAAARDGLDRKITLARDAVRAVEADPPPRRPRRGQ